LTAFLLSLSLYFSTKAIMSVANGPSGKNDFYLNSLDHFLTDAATVAAKNDDTSKLATMTRTLQQHQLHFLVGSGSNQHNQLLLRRENNGACLVKGEDAHERKEIVLCTQSTETNGENNDDRPKQLHVGGGHSGLLTQGGRLYIWGWNESGQLGTSGFLTDESDSEAPPPPLGGIVKPLLDILVETAAFGFSHTLIVEKETGRLFCFGSNERGQVDGTLSSKVVASPITPSFLAGEKVSAVAAGLFHSAVITSEGELVTFGCGRFGQSLSSESDKSDVNVLVWVGRWKPADGSRLVGVACGRRHTAVLDDQGRIWTFGENKHGQLGRSIVGEEKKDPVPRLVEGFEPVVSASHCEITCGWSHTIMRIESADGTSAVYGWGRNDKGQLGTGTTESVPVPRRLFANNSKTIRSIVCGSESTLALDEAGDVWGCGWNEHGNLALGTDKDALELTKTVGARIVAPHDGKKIVIAAGGAHFLAARV
jgi:alpha-tubulin suppressor-like RCC1 family protein